VLGAYARPHYERVVYRAPPALAELVRRDAEEEGAGALIVVETDA